MDRYEVILTDVAKKDIRQAVDWEDHRKPVLGDRFLDELLERLFQLEETPESGSIRYSDIRCTSLYVFPYTVHYAVFRDEQTVQILRVLHQAKEPFW